MKTHPEARRERGPASEGTTGRPGESVRGATDRQPYLSREVSGISTRYYRKAESAAARIMEAFQRGSLPQALAPIFIHRRDNVPCRA